jgi:hypothetical protein
VTSIFAPPDDKLKPEHWPETGFSGDPPSKAAKAEYASPPPAPRPLRPPTTSPTAESLLIREETVTDAVRNLAVVFLYVGSLLVFLVTR